MVQLVEHAKSRTIVPVSFEIDVESKEEENNAGYVNKN